MSRELQCSTPCWRRRTNLIGAIQSAKGVKRYVVPRGKLRSIWNERRTKETRKRKKKKEKIYIYIYFFFFFFVNENESFNEFSKKRTPVRTSFLPMLLLFPYFLCCPPSPPCRAALHAGACWPWRPTRYCQPSFHAPLVALRIFLKGAPFLHAGRELSPLSTPLFSFYLPTPHPRPSLSSVL